MDMKFRGYTITLQDPVGSRGFVPYSCKRDSDGFQVAAGALSRFDYLTDERFKAAVKAMCRKALK